MKTIPLVVSLLCLPVPTPTAASPEPMKKKTDATTFRQTLIDVERNIRVDDWSIDHGGLDLETPHRWSVRKYVLHGGRQEGVDMLEIRNGTLSFKVIPTRGMNLWDARCEGMRLGWDSPVTEVVHPKFVDLQSRGGLGWLEGFGEWVNRCGLASNGLPGTDRVRSNTGEIVEVQLTLHGKVSYIPARRVEVVIEPPPSRRIVVRGIVDETMMFGPRLRLITEISTVPGSKSLRIDDRIENLAATPQEMQILYHVNFGRPLLEEGARFLAPVERVTPRDDRAADGIDSWNEYGPPRPGYVEQVYFLKLLAGNDGRTEAVLRNGGGTRGVSLRFSTEELPYMTLWKNTAAEENGYVTGLEPATNYPNLRSIERKHGRVPLLEGGESYRAGLEITALTNGGEVEKAVDRIEGIKGSTGTRVDETPAAE